MIAVRLVYEEGGRVCYLVRGTQDVGVARFAAIREAGAGALALLVARPGLYRWNPCHESSCYDGGGHRGHLCYATRPGRGTFRGVYFA